MFDVLTDKLNSVFRSLTSKGRLTEKDVDEALRHVRLALLEADVNFKVARDFVAKVRERVVGQAVLESLTPGQTVIKIVNEEMTAILSGGDHRMGKASQPPTVLMLVGLQGSGKTTTAAKLALHLRRGGQSAMLVAADLRRPAAIQQLMALGKQLDVPVYHEETSSTPVKVAEVGVKRAKELGLHWVIVDTGGRLHIDDELMGELAEIRGRVSPTETLLVVDSMTGQDAVNAASEFHARVPLTGLIMTKLDGDARGGAALSITRVTGVPIKFIGVGERPDGLEPFYPDRLASRILGMGDVLTLIEKTQEMVDEKKAKELEKKIRKATFDLNDFLDQLQAMKRMGSITSFMEMVPGFNRLSKKLPANAFDEKQIKKVEAIVRSMTGQERRNPDIINGSRRRRIAVGSGTQPADVNHLINQFGQAQRMMKQLSQGKGPRQLMQMMKGGGR
ncbi:MAG: signal recognition particle protein [SAR202 cluster bacterium]|nr:signal recognition particle protein [SAR202 cluster bacterium]